MRAQITPLLPFSPASVARNPSFYTSFLWEGVKPLLKVGGQLANPSKSGGRQRKTGPPTKDRAQKRDRLQKSEKPGANFQHRKTPKDGAKDGASRKTRSKVPKQGQESQTKHSKQQRVPQAEGWRWKNRQKIPKNRTSPDESVAFSSVGV